MLFESLVWVFEDADSKNIKDDKEMNADSFISNEYKKYHHDFEGYLG